MFGIFKKDPLKKLENQYQKLMTDAVEYQRNGNIDKYSQLVFEADQLYKEIEKMKDIKSNDN